MDTGQKASAVLHLGLVGWVLVFDLFHAPSSDLELPVAEVSLISATEFAALSAPPAPAPEPAPMPVPEPTPPPAQPEPGPQPEPAPEPEPESTGAIFSPVPTPGATERPAPRPVDRVAPTPTEAPPEDATVDLTAQPQTSADAPGDVVLPEQEQVAPPEATTEIVTEATETATDSLERAAAAPTVSPRPRTRPERPAPVEVAETPEPSEDPAPAPEPEAEPVTDVATEVADAVAAALADSLAGIGNAPQQTGLSASEADRLRLAIQQCWNIGTLSTEAQQITVTLGFSMTPGAMPEQGSIYLVDSTGGTDGAVSQAFEAARRAIIRCASSTNGYGLPPESYEAWRNVEITFNPEGMRLR
ncbi:MAG: hypothetical protein JXQ79_06500 [Rhodobacteraceae bacterium]|nr:hypothetical protein [Paracoccaceae bacterium]